LTARHTTANLLPCFAESEHKNENPVLKDGAHPAGPGKSSIGVMTFPKAPRFVKPEHRFWQRERLA
jgi:hypothetical protein